jgi:micrococcal nuclease
MFSRLFKCYGSGNTNTNSSKSESKKIQWTDTLQFVPPISEGDVIKVYDGDTFTLAGYLPYDGSPLYRFSVRLNGIDCAEIKGATEEEKEYAIKARLELEKLIMDKKVTLKNVKNEKYGRLLADVFIGDLHINQYMIDRGLAVEYDGKTKKTISWFEIYKSKNII